MDDQVATRIAGGRPATGLVCSAPETGECVLQGWTDRPVPTPPVDAGGAVVGADQTRLTTESFHSVVSGSEIVLVRGYVRVSDQVFILNPNGGLWPMERSRTIR